VHPAWDPEKAKRIVEERRSQTRGEAAVIRELIAARSSKRALDEAKIFHKRAGTAESEAVLFEAYVARVEGLFASGLTQEARALIELVKGRFPAARDCLAALEIDLAARRSDWQVLLRALADPRCSPERRLAIERAVTRPGQG